MNDKLPSLEVRDFLFYIVPGTFVLLAILLYFQSLKSDITTLGDLSKTTLAVVLAYGIGHICHSLQHPWRWILKVLFHKKLHGEPSCAWEEKQAHFKNAWLWVMENHQQIYNSYIERPRSLSRFSLAMISPLIILSISVQHVYSSISCITLWAGTVIAVCLLISRYIRYDRRFRERVWLVIHLEDPRHKKESENS